MQLQKDIEQFLYQIQMDFVYFIDISDVSDKGRQGMTTAVLFGKALTKTYLQKVSKIPDYVAQLILNKTIDQDEFHNTELFTDQIADQLSTKIMESGFEAFSQSEANIEKSGLYHKKEYRTPLPHKTIALRAGIGWIGKNDLLITPEYGCAISMCSVLSNAPFQTRNHALLKQKCGTCTVCQNTCQPNAISGKEWELTTNRDGIFHVHKCSPCFQCVVQCPYTKRYANSY
ncbi:MAG: hypothetical protein N4A71_03040 [Carboxylicivirga sp.]|jgi:epoxyqueuosine reductase QueG|nr:hypothetical protein [Carboxylicivirga sp.]